MLTFEKLVQETAQRVGGVQSDITPVEVRKVLQDTGIDETLRDASPVPQGRLIVHSVTITGQKTRADGIAEPFRYHRELGSGLWVWVGSNGTGKSTILNCILWALTGSDSDISKRVRSWLHDILVQFSVGGEQFTSYLSRQNDAVMGGIYKGFITADHIDLGPIEPVALFASRDELREVADMFFMQHLGITTLRWTAHSAEKDDPDLHAHSTTWRTYAHAVHIDDDSYDHLIIDPTKGYGRQDRKILEMMLGVEYSRAVAEIQVQADFAKEAYGRARARAGNRQSNVADQIASLDQERMQVEQEIATLDTGKAPVEDDTVFVQRRERRSTAMAEQNRLSQEVSALRAQQMGIENAIVTAEREKFAATEQSEVEYLINSLVVVRCPHCEAAVDAHDRLALERQEHTCHVCAQPIQRTRTQGDLKTLIREHDQEMSTLRSALRRVQQDISDCSQRLESSYSEAMQISRELETNVQQARDGFSATYATLLIRKGQIDGQLDQLRRVETDMQAEQTEVETAARWNFILQTASEIADESAFSINEDVYTQLGVLVVQLATQFGVPDLQQVLIDEKRYVRLVQGGLTVSHNDLARSERVKFKVAFHVALMLLRAEKGLGRHPGFLIIDTPGTAEVDEADFIAMTQDLARIQREHGADVQILMATARPEAIQNLPAEVVSSATGGAAFF